MVSKLPDGMEKGDMEDLIGNLLELRGQYRKLQWYGEVNRRGFVKITKKLNKKIPSSTAQSRYLGTKVDPKPFATNNKLTLDMRAINEWLSGLGEVKVSDDSSSIHSGSSGSLRRIASKSTMKVSPTTLDAMEQAAREDDMQKLSELLDTVSGNATKDAQSNLNLDLLQRAISNKAVHCIEGLLQRVSSIDQEDDMNKRNCLHRLVISIGRARALELSGGQEGQAFVPASTAYINAAEPPVRVPGIFKVEERDPANSVGKDEQAEQLLTFVLDHLVPEQRPAIVTKDIYGRMPLHYAAQYGLVAVSLELMRCMQAWEHFDISDGLDSATWQDSEGYAPFHLAVISGHYRTLQALLLVDDLHKSTYVRLEDNHVEKSGAALELATKYNYHRIVKLLVDAGVDVNYQDAQGETALHVAARFGHEECARILLEDSKFQKINIELAEKTYGWTPIFIACVDGHLGLVKLLLSKDADVSKPDLSGWTPLEHAALRGHLEIARYLSQFTPPPSVHPSPEIIVQESISRLKGTSLGDRRSNGVSKDGAGNTPRAPEPVKEFGHRYLRDESMILVGLGSMDERKAREKPPIMLEIIELARAHATQLDTALSIVVSAQGAEGEPFWIDLPIQEDITTSPISFTTKDPTKMKIFFDVVPTWAGSIDKRLGRGMALLSSIKPSIGSKRMNLQGDLSVPLLSSGSLEHIGVVNFNFLIIEPFKHPNMSISTDRTYWKKSSTMVIGHRGLGKNMSTKTSLQLGENTIQSFITAANLGASYVEFDVQMTKDHVPVIYHDFLVSETGADVPVHTLTLEQFLAFGEGTPRNTRTPSPSGIDSRAGNTRGRIQRSYSVGARTDEPNMRERMRHTRDFKSKGFKGNSRGDSIQAPLHNAGGDVQKAARGGRLQHRNEISHAVRIRGARDGHLRGGAQLFRRHGAQASLRPGQEAQHHLLLLPSRRLPPALVQAAFNPRALPYRRRSISSGRRPRQLAARGNSFREPLEFARHRQRV